MDDPPARPDVEPPPRLDEAAVRERLRVLDEQLARLEVARGPAAELALVAISGLAAVYGEALARTLDRAEPAQLERLLADELIGHLLVLHGLHPEPEPPEVRTAPTQRTRPPAFIPVESLMRRPTGTGPR